MTSRREQILDTAATLFAERGFHGVSMHDIGGACGISGPALYKHFTGKDDILTRSLTAISEHLLAGGRSRSDAVASAETALDALIDFHTEFALDHPALIVIQEREWANLGIQGRRDVRALQLAYVDIWVDTVRRLRDDLDAAEARAVVQATFGLLNSTPHSARISEDAMRSRLGRMARAALKA
ncbi:MAG: TetR family transcriptional regulator [Aeromicrobium sp.]|jgi:AcrR family transcriptional regulator|nr:TetR family transcriptional regulator [Aeromicrobium sp.]